MKLYRLVIPGGAYGERSEYACASCLPRALDQNTGVMRVDPHVARADEHCPQCGKGAS